MKKQLISMLHRFSNLMHLPSMIQLSGQRLFLPFYHSIQGAEALPHLQHLYPLRNETTFRKDLDYLLENFQPIDLSQLKEFVLEGKKMEQNYMHLTFDDGLREVHDLVLPILEEKGIPATLFINKDFVDNKNLFFRFKISLIIDSLKKSNWTDKQEKSMHELLASKMGKREFSLDTCSDILLNLGYEDIPLIDTIAAALQIDFEAFLLKQRPYLTSNQIRDAIHRGFTVGGHSVNHPIYSHLTLDEQLEQTEESIRFVQQTFEVNEKVFSFPFTDDGVERTFFEVVEQDKIAELTFGCAGLKQDDFPFHLQRFPMETTAQDAHRLVSTEYFYYLSKAPFGKNKLSRT